MPGNPAKLGPFVGGLNNKSQTGEAKADEVVELINFEVTTDEALTSRPPIEIMDGTYRSPLTTSTVWKVLSIFRRSPAEWYLIVSEPLVEGGIDKVKVVAYLNGNLNSVPTEIEAPTTAENEVADAVQFADEVFFVRDTNAAIPGFRWGPQTGYEALSSMPRGRVIVSWKSRLWVAGRTDSSGLGAQLRYSDIEPDGPKPESWNAANYIDIAYGEGGFITSILPVQNNLIIFKSDGTWRFNYPSQVKDGSVDVLSSTIGAADRHAAVELENVIYVYDQGSVYEMVNSTFTKINGVIEIRDDPASVNAPRDSVELSVLNRRIMVHYSNATYALSIETKSWSQWQTYNGIPGRFIELPASSSTSSSPVYISASCGETIRRDNLLVGFDNVSSISGAPVVEDESLIVPGYSEVQFSAPFAVGDSTPQSFNIPVSIDHTLELEFTLDAGLFPSFRYEGLERSGVVSSIPLSSPTDLGGGRWRFTKKLDSSVSSDGSSLLAVRLIVNNTTNLSVALSSVTVSRSDGNAPALLFRIQDSYEDSANSKELIFCRVKTRGTDFNSPQTWKRLYWWGMDIKTFFETVAVAAPAAKEPKVYWREIDSYTNNQLRQGTYRNPLSWLLKSVAVFNRHEPEYDISADGRFFKKLAKALRFQRISFEYETKTHGTLATGPAKLFTITPMVKDKRVVVDTNT